METARRSISGRSQTEEHLPESLHAVRGKGGVMESFGSRCPLCNARVQVSLSLRGKKVKCKQCSGVFVVPQDLGPAAETTAGQHPAAQRTVAQPQAPSSEPCPYCGLLVPKGTSDCPHCAASLRPPAASPLTSARSPLTPVRRKQSNRTVWIIGGVAVVAIVALVALSVGLVRRGPTAPPPASPAATALALDWPESERAEATVSLNGTSMQLPRTGNVEYPVAAGTYRIVLQQRGYQPIDTTLPLQDGERRSYRPVWLAASTPPPAGRPAASTPPGTVAASPLGSIPPNPASSLGPEKSPEVRPTSAPPSCRGRR